MASFSKGVVPIMAVEMGRRAIPSHVRPRFAEVEKACRSATSAAGPLEGEAAPVAKAATAAL